MTISSKDALKKAAADAAMQYVTTEAIVGVGTGSTVSYFIDALASRKHTIEGAVASSVDTAEKLKKAGIALLDANSVDHLTVYVDGTDSVNKHLQLIKGAGGALVREKILAAMAKKFICIADKSKWADLLTTDTTPLPIEVIPMARSYVARELVKLGAMPVYRQGYLSDNGNMILDVYNLNLAQILETETRLNNIAGVVGHGLFASHPADILLLADEAGVKTLCP